MAAPKTVNVFFCHAPQDEELRRKLETEPAHPRHLITEPGIGYRLMP